MKFLTESSVIADKNMRLTELDPLIMAKKMLMITYAFPPRGGGGVQRNVKFLKYLARLGWEASVLTVKETGINLYDSTLLDEINSNIFRAGSFDPHRVFAKLKNIFGKSKPHSFNQINEVGKRFFTGFKMDPVDAGETLFNKVFGYELIGSEHQFFDHAVSNILGLFFNAYRLAV